MSKNNIGWLGPCRSCGQTTMVSENNSMCVRCAGSIRMFERAGSEVALTPQNQMGFIDQSRELVRIGHFAYNSFAIPTRNGPLSIIGVAAFAVMLGAGCFAAMYEIAPMFNWSSVVSNFAGAIALLTGLVVPVVLASQPNEVELTQPDEFDEVPDRLVSTGKNTAARADLPPDIPGNFSPSDYIEFAKACLKRGVSEGKLARGDNKVCSQRQYKAILKWMLGRNIVRENGAGYSLSGRGVQILQYISGLNFRDFESPTSA